MKTSAVDLGVGDVSPSASEAALETCLSAWGSQEPRVGVMVLLLLLFVIPWLTLIHVFTEKRHLMWDFSSLTRGVRSRASNPKRGGNRKLLQSLISSRDHVPMMTP